MTEIVVDVTLSEAPVNGLAVDPEISIIRVDTGALVVTDDAMTDTTVLGKYSYSFTPVAGLDYSFQIDADPSATGQVDLRYFNGAFNNELNDMWNDHSLNPSVPKTITENTEGSDYDEDVASPTAIHKDVVKVAGVTTIDRT